MDGSTPLIAIPLSDPIRRRLASIFATEAAPMNWECQPLALRVFPDVGKAATGGMLRPIVRMTDTEARDCPQRPHCPAGAASLPPQQLLAASACSTTILQRRVMSVLAPHRNRQTQLWPALITRQSAPSRSKRPKKPWLIFAAHHCHEVAGTGAGHWRLTGRATRNGSETRAVLGDRIRLAQGGSSE